MLSTALRRPVPWLPKRAARHRGSWSGDPATKGQGVHELLLAQDPAKGLPPGGLKGPGKGGGAAGVAGGFGAYAVALKPSLELVHVGLGLSCHALDALLKGLAHVLLGPPHGF